MLYSAFFGNTNFKNCIIQGANIVKDPKVSSGGSSQDLGGNKFLNPSFINAPLGSSAPTAIGDFHILNSHQL